jgi:hypothetical protein
MYNSRFVKSLTLLAVFISGPMLAAVPDAPSAQRIVENWRHAVHDGGCLRGAIHLHYAAHEDGLDGVMGVWLDGDGNYRRVTDRGLDRDEIQYFKGDASRRDWNGFVRRVDGDELKELTADIAEVRTLACGPGKQMEEGAVSVDPSGLLVLHVVPPGGVDMDWFVDPKTALPVRSEHWAGEGDRVTVSYGDWRGRGTQTPYRLAMGDSDKVEAVYTLQSLDHSRAGDFKTALPSDPSDVTMTGSVAEFPFTMEANHIVFPVSVNGHAPLGFLLDTGDGRESLNSAHIAEFGLSTYGATGISGGGNQTQDAFVKRVDLALPAGVALHGQHADIFDMTRLEHVLGVKLGGILGYDFLSRFVIEIDYQAKIMRLHPADWSYAGNGVRLPITFDDGIPYGDGAISVPTKPDLPVHVVMDFGAAETMTFTAPFIQANDLRALAGTNAAVNRPAGSEKEFFAQSNSRGRIDALRLGGLVQHAIPVNLSANTGGAYGQGQFAATVGESIYSRYHVFLDYPRHQIIFEATPETGKPFPERRTFGLTLLASGDDLHTYTVTAVRAGSPAAALGFQIKDTIADCDGKPASQFTLAELRDWLAKEGNRHTLTVLRDGKPVKLSVTVTLVSIDR